ncbi:MAG: hypothetical protein MMC33_001227 [Icmadophila ericetorum]|nr:hypothetical protein [Icmadophila ericetorum]
MDRSAPSRPLNVQQIVKQAQSFEYNPLVPFKYWLRSAGTLLKEAEIYEREGNDQQTYLLLFRHAQLVLGNLSLHPDARSTANRLALVQAEKDVNNNLAKLEILKPRINRKYERFEQLLKDREARKASESRKASIASLNENGSRDGEGHRRAPSDSTISGIESLAAGENKELAVRLAHNEIKRRATARKATRQAGVPEEVEQERRGAGVWGNWEQAFVNDQQTKTDKENLSQQMQDINRQMNREKGGHSRKKSSTSENTRSTNYASYNYPSAPKTSNYAPLKSDLATSWIAPRSTSQSPSPPDRPPKEDTYPSTYDHVPPPRPEKSFFLDGDSSSRSTTASPTPPQQDLKPSTFAFKPSAYLENGTPLRTIFLPPDLRSTFLKIAGLNTRANLETCGVLCGTLISNALFVSKLVIPEQKSTSDTCETVNEGALFDYVDGEDLMVLGWIHTHPTQTCFMSSRDLHTHCGYQVMMAESIAIVCAPSKGEWGVFRLTDPPGMQCVLNCTQQGLFHPHAEENIYTDALRPGHVFEAKGLEFEVVDLRPGRS